MSRYRRMPVAELTVDDRYQRPLDEKRVQAMADDFQDRLFGTLEVSQRNGRAAIFDGQHRFEAAKRIGRDVVACLVHTDLTPEQEAELFVELQRRRKSIHPVDRFKARVFCGEPAAVAINETVENAGFRVYAGSGRENGERRQIAAVGALDHIHRRGVLAETLELLSGVWGGDVKSTDGYIIAGLGIVVDGYGHRIGEEEVQKLREIPPATIIRRALGKAQTFGTNPEARGHMVAGEIRKVMSLRGAPRKSRPPKANDG